MAVINVSIPGVVDTYLALFRLDNGNLHFIIDTDSPDGGTLTYENTIYREKTANSVADILDGENQPVKPVYVGGPVELKDDPLIAEVVQ